jgi:hypothetical protein
MCEKIDSHIILIKEGRFSHLLDGMMAIPFALSIMGVVVGLLVVASGQISRAMVDNADNTRQILAFIKRFTLEKKHTNVRNTKT